ncbi:hypothetical protein [Natrinema gelatinilyticum]|uniref:hypothetical protein n=1 Tax=Natrinema gelatinilyticum TaxID=2961571 RepID=UPI0020C4FF73|nr:hypothetical protein [Natrinema gelatinilyticum]
MAGRNSRTGGDSFDHNHLPKLEAYGFIRWDKNTHEVEKGPAFEHVRPLLEMLDSQATEFTCKWP